MVPRLVWPLGLLLIACSPPPPPVPPLTDREEIERALAVDCPARQGNCDLHVDGDEAVVVGPGTGPALHIAMGIRATTDPRALAAIERLLRRLRTPASDVAAITGFIRAGGSPDPAPTGGAVRISGFCGPGETVAAQSMARRRFAGAGCLFAIRPRPA